MAAVEWLRELLAAGPMLTKDIETASKEAGMSMATVRRAKDELGIQPRKQSFSGAWEWALPAVAQHDSDHPRCSTQKRDEHLGESPYENSTIPAQKPEDAQVRLELSVLGNTPVSTLGQRCGRSLRVGRTRRGLRRRWKARR
jgi:hypothetical protein